MTDEPTLKVEPNRRSIDLNELRDVADLYPKLSKDDQLKVIFEAGDLRKNRADLGLSRGDSYSVILDALTISRSEGIVLDKAIGIAIDNFRNQPAPVQTTSDQTTPAQPLPSQTTPVQTTQTQPLSTSLKMTEPGKELYAALLADLVDLSPENQQKITTRLSTLPDEIKGRVFQALKKYPAGVDLASILTSNGIDKLGKKTSWTGDELLDAVFPDPVWLVPDMIPVGLVSLAGRPKIGKSWLALQLAISVASGGVFLGTKVEQAGVLYIAFEDPGRRLKDRILKVGLQRGMPVLFKTDYRLLNAEGLDDLAVEIESGRYKLIVIDTFGRSIGQIQIKDYSENVMTLSPLQRMAQDNNVAILLVDHHGKMTGNDNNPIVDLIGSIGKAATFDTLLGLYREKGQRGANLKIIGRDQDESDLQVEFDQIMGCWQLLGDTKTVFQKNVIKAVTELKANGILVTTTKIVEYLQSDLGNTSRAISMLLSTGALVKLPKIGKEQPFDLP